VAAQHQPSEKPGSINGKEHPTWAAGAHGLDVDAFWQHGHLSPAEKRDVARLVEHRLAHRQQDDHDPHAEGESQEEEQRAELADPEMTKGEGEQH
jgi:hypothetical protein